MKFIVYNNKPILSEHSEQVIFFDWVRYMQKVRKDKRFNLIYAIPNGGSRHPAEAHNLKRAGVMAGVSDIAVDVPMGEYHGLKIEMKVKGNKVTEKQVAYLEAVAEQGYKTAVCYGADEAIKAVKEYFNL